jgi:hypothetical protein
LSGIPDISTLAALQLKKRLPEVVSTIQARLKSDGAATPRDLVLQVLNEETNHARGHKRGCLAVGTRRRPDVTRLRDIVDHLASLPDPEQVLAGLAMDDVVDGARLETAWNWLKAFSDSYARHRRVDSTSTPLDHRLTASNP